MAPGQEVLLQSVTGIVYSGPQPNAEHIPSNR
jgi:hypothetical protein